MVIVDNLSNHNSDQAAKMLKDLGAWFLFLPPCSPDLNSIEMAFAKLKALILNAAPRSYEDSWQAASAVCDLFSSEECENFFNATGYEGS